MTADDSNVADLLRSALARHRSGDLPAAGAIYQRILQIDPNHVDASHFLGVCHLQAGRPGEAIPLIERALQSRSDAAAHNNLGEAYRVTHQLAAAEAHYLKALNLNPGLADAHANLSLLLLEQRQPAQAEAPLSRAAQLAPRRIDFLFRLSRLRFELKDLPGATEAARRATQLQPRNAEGWSLLANALAGLRNDADALIAAERCVTLAPDRAEAHATLGAVHEQAGRAELAERSFRQAVAVQPGAAAGHRGLAGFFDRNGDNAAAIAPLEKALSLQPSDAPGWNNLSLMRRKNNNAAGAVAAAETAVRLTPADPTPHGTLGLALLASGAYQRGFAEYEWRWRCDNFTTAPRQFTQPMWDGRNPAGRTILVHTEQGFGDTLQFIRYAPLLAQRGATVIVETSAPLRPLIANMAGVSRVVVHGVRFDDFDWHCPLLSLPRAFGTTLETVPGNVPYLSPPEDYRSQWHARFSPTSQKRVGIVWAGNARPDPNRSCPAEALNPLSALDHIEWFSLQKFGDQRISATAPALPMIDLAPDIKNFADSAAAMMELDLIVSIDTAAAHLAGALGRPIWTLLPWNADWRWLEGRTDSPWYPTMRLFRQPEKGDWASVMRPLGRALGELR